MAIGLIIAAGTAIYQKRQENIAIGKQNKAARAQKRIARAQEARKRRAAVQEAQIAGARVEAAGAATEGGASSNVISANTTIASQLGSNLSFLAATTAESEIATNALSDAAQNRSNSATAGAVGGLALQNDTRLDNLFK